MATVYIEPSSTDEKFLFEGNGDEPPRRKKRYVTRDRQILRAKLSQTDRIPEFSEKFYGRELNVYAVY